MTEAGTTPLRPEWVVPLQSEGRGRPVFFFPSAHSERGSLMIEARLAQHVGREHPFWGFALDATHRERVRLEGVNILGAAYAAQMRAIQPVGPYLLYGNCLGAYLAWETAGQLLEAGEDVAGILFYEAPIRSDFGNVRRGPIPVDARNHWRLLHYVRVRPLPVHLAHVMTAEWHASGWWKPWREVALGSYETVVVPGETESAFVDREERIARHVREWIEAAENRLREASPGY